MRLIDADALKEKLLKERDAIPLTRTERYGFGVEFPNHHGESMRGGIKKALRCMEQTPTIDAVPVVRCTECKHRDPENHHCDHPAGATIYFPRKDDDFCSYGERRDDDS